MGSVTRVGSRDVVATGSVIALPGDQLTINIADLTFRIRFDKETSSDEPAISTDIIGNELLISLKNFNNVLPASWAGNVAILNGRKLKMAVFVQSLGSAESATRLVNYTFSAGGEANG